MPPTAAPPKRASKRKPRPLTMADIEKLNADCRARAARLGCDPVGPPEFSQDILGLNRQIVSQWRSAIKNGRPFPLPPLPDETWVLSGNRPAWPRAVAVAYRVARENGDRTFKAPRVQCPDALRPMGQVDIADYCGVEKETARTWMVRGRLPEPTWPAVGMGGAWAFAVIEAWWNMIQDELRDHYRTSAEAKGRIAQELVRSLREQGALVTDESGIVRVSNATVRVKPAEVEAFAAM